MKKQIGILYFSPTGSTKKICQDIATGMGERNPAVINITAPDIRHQLVSNSNAFTESIDHLIIGAPVHSGKLPVQVIDSLKDMKIKGKTSSAVVVYGNRDYGIALSTMVKLLTEAGFKVVSAAAFIGQHSYSDILPVGVGRPDESDKATAHKFALESLNSENALEQESIPIQFDKYSTSPKYTSLKPVFFENVCHECGKCSALCPLGLISIESGAYLSPSGKKQCIGCIACVKGCKKKARVIKVNPIVKIIVNRLLNQAASIRQAPTWIVS